MFNQIRQIIETKFTNKLPTVDQIYSEADALREVFKTLYPVTDEEFESIKKRLPENILHSIGYADTLRKRDSAHQCCNTFLYIQEHFRKMLVIHFPQLQI